MERIFSSVHLSPAYNPIVRVMRDKIFLFEKNGHLFYCCFLTQKKSLMQKKIQDSFCTYNSSMVMNFCKRLLYCITNAENNLLKAKTSNRLFRRLILRNSCCAQAYYLDRTCFRIIIRRFCNT